MGWRGEEEEKEEIMGFEMGWRRKRNNGLCGLCLTNPLNVGQVFLIHDRFAYIEGQVMSYVSRILVLLARSGFAIPSVLSISLNFNCGKKFLKKFIILESVRIWCLSTLATKINAFLPKNKKNKQTKKT